MKLLSKFFVSALALAIAGGAVSCSKEDSDDITDPAGSEMSAPRYEKYAARYDVTSAGSGIKSVEFTSAGNYIILTDYNYHNSARKNAAAKKSIKEGVFFNKVLSRAYSDIIEGTYTMNGDDEYILEGFGKIKVVKEGDNACSLDIVRSNGSTETLTASVRNQMPESTITNNLCRTWNADKVQLICEFGKKKFDRTVGIRDINKLIRDYAHWGLDNFPQISDEEDFDPDDMEYDMDELPEQVIFSKSGTYMVKYADNTLAISTWSWKDASKGLLYYSWNYDDIYDDDEGGLIQVFFRDNKLTVIENLLDLGDYDEDDYREYAEYIPSRIEFRWHFVQ